MNDEHINDGPIEGGERDELHELLCAHLLGETDAEDAARVEAALAESAELRAEAARLEATLALVRGHGVGPAGEGEADAEQRVERIAAAAIGGGAQSSAPPEPSPAPIPFWSRPSVRAAAAALVMVSAAVAYRAIEQQGALREGAAPFTYSTFGGEVASADAAAPAKGSEQSSPRAERELVFLGYFDDSTGAPAAAPKAELPRGAGSAGGRIRSKEKTLGGAAGSAPDAVFDSVQFHDVIGVGGGVSGGQQLGRQARTAQPPTAGVQLELARSQPAAPPGSKVAPSETKLGLSRLRSLGYLAGEQPPIDMSNAAGPPSAGFFYDDGEGGVSKDQLDLFAALEGVHMTTVDVDDERGRVAGRKSLESTDPMSPELLEALRRTGYLSEESGAATRGSLTGSGDFYLGTGPVNQEQDEISTLRRLLQLVDSGQLDAYGEVDRDQLVLRLATLEAEQQLAKIQLELDIDDSELPGLLEALGYLDPGYVGDLTDDVGREAVRRFVGAQRSEVERRVNEQRLQDLLADCRRIPGESLQDMFFRHWGQRPFVSAAVDPLSTFSADVDTASYALARRMLLDGVLPQKSQIRTEEFVNYFDPELSPPTDDVFAIHTDLGPAAFAPTGSGTWMLRVGVAGKQVAQADRKPMHLTFVVDTSGSMRREDRIDLVRQSLRLLSTQLDARDEISIVRFSNDASVLLERANATDRGRIEAAIALLEPGGGTNVQSGLELGYTLAAAGLGEDANNRVVFLSDGVGNIGETDQNALIEQVADRRAKGIYLNTIGFGLENHNDVFLEQLADRGDGLCNYVDTALEARRALVENFTGTFETIARDVKLQVEFDPARVGRYRLLGYENRAIADREFRNSDVDAAEIGAGHTVVALYELENVDLSDEGGPLATVRVRWSPPFDASADRATDPDEPPADEIEREIEASVSVEQALWSFEALPRGFAAAQCAAQLAEVLMRSAFTRGDSIASLVERSAWVADRWDNEAFREFASMVAANRAPLESAIEPADAMAESIDALKFLRYELEREREADGQPDAGQLEALEQQVREREEQLRRQLLGSQR